MPTRSGPCRRATTTARSRWRAVKIAFSKALRKAGLGHAGGHTDLGAPLPATTWLPDDAEYARLVDYVHRNPLRHGLCGHADDWPWSSLHRFVAAGYPLPG